MKLTALFFLFSAIAHSQETPTKACAILTANGPNQAFHSAPLILPRGVTLFIDRGVTLYASRNPRDYDLAPGSCGAAPRGNAAACKPFLYSYQAAYSGVAGAGIVDGQGAAWWDMVRAGEKSGES